ncbi:MAG: hypothetical protein ACUZ8O_01030 [Candidatus Anammoxibacter sp.]
MPKHYGVQAHAAEVPSLERGAKIVDRGEREEIVQWTILGSSQHVGWP